MTGTTANRKKVGWRLGKRAGGRLAQGFSLLVIGVGALFVLFPVLWMLSTSLKPGGNVFLLPVRIIPRRFVWTNYPEALEFMHWQRVFGNSLYVCGMTVLGVVLSSAITAYPFARLNAPGKNGLFFLVISVMMLPGQVTLIPQFLLFRQLGWIDTLKPLFVPAFFGAPYHIFLLRQFFRTINKELDDAAIIDGCGYFGIFWRIIFPLAKPAITSVAIFTFQWTWNDFFRPLIFLNQQQKWTVALGLRAFDNMGWGNRSWSQLMAAALTSLLPMVIVFFVMQRYFIQGVVFTGLKG